MRSGETLSVTRVVSVVASRVDGKGNGRVVISLFALVGLLDISFHLVWLCLSLSL